MMDCGKKTLILFTLCALVGTNKAQNLISNLEALVSVPSTHIGDTEIVSAVLTITAGHPFMYTVVAQKNQTQCVSDPVCLSAIKEPALDVSVSVSSRASTGKTFTYSNSINGSLELVIHVGHEISVTPQIVNGESDGITVILDIMYNQNNTRSGSLSSGRRPTIFTLNTEFITTTEVEDKDDGNGKENGQGNGQGNGQSALCSAPFCALLLLALLPFLLLK